MSKVYFGTYTRGLSEGIYQADFDNHTGQLSNLENIIKTDTPSYLVFSQKNAIYAIIKEGDQGGIVAFNANGEYINKVLLPGAPLCHLAVDEKRQLVYGANYHKGELTVYKILDNQGLELTDKVQLTGSGPHPNQKTPHAHFVGLTPDKYLVTCDLGSDAIRTYNLINNRLQEISRYDSVPGAGSRHLVFHPKEKIAYVLCELNATVEVLIYNGRGRFERLQIISTLPKDYHDFNATAAIRISEDGRYLYTSNRGHNSIATFKIRKDGQLDLMEMVPSHGDTPRDFNLTPDQKHLIVAHQESPNATVFKRDVESGKITLLSSDFYLPDAICVTFKP